MVLVVGRVLHILPQGRSVWGVTSLDNLLYVLRYKASYQISVYDTTSYRLQRRLNVPGLIAAMADMVSCAYNHWLHISCNTFKYVGLLRVADMVSCAHNYCLYISCDQCIHRVALPDAAVTKWQVNEKVNNLSVTDIHSVLVTCSESRQVKEFTTFGILLRQVRLAQDVMSPCHAIQLSSGQFLVCHGDDGDRVGLHRVCLVGADGEVVKAYGGPRGSGSRQMDKPYHLAVDGNGFFYVVDALNRRLLLLSPELTYVRDIASYEQLKWDPMRLFLDADKGRLYVAENDWNDGELKTGRVTVVCI